MKQFTIYTDGACSGNPGPGGWAAIVKYKDKSKYTQGGAYPTTNNRMEIQAVIEGLRTLTEQCEVDVYSDSAYVVNAFCQNWVEQWQRNAWNRGSKPIKNQDLWMELIELTKKHKVSFHKSRGAFGRSDE